MSNANQITVKCAADLSPGDAVVNNEAFPGDPDWIVSDVRPASPDTRMWVSFTNGHSAAYDLDAAFSVRTSTKGE